MRARPLGVVSTLLLCSLAGRAFADTAPKRIADLWPAHNELLIMLGAADRIAVTVDRKETHRWMFRVAPAMEHAVQLQAMQAEPEALLASGVDQVVVGRDNAYADALRRAGIPTLALSFNNGDQLMRTLSRTADLVGTPYAHQIADRYDAALRDRLASLQAVVGRLPEGARPLVLHISSLSPLRADTGGIFADWIAAAGGRMVVPAPGDRHGEGGGPGGPGGPDAGGSGHGGHDGPGVPGGDPGGGPGPGDPGPGDPGGPGPGGFGPGGPDHGGGPGAAGRAGAATSIEQIVAWNPDVLIIGADAGPFDPSALGGLWKQIRAVQTGRVYRNPSGVFPWDRYGSEYLLQLSWAAKVLHPELFGSIDMVALTRAFYHDYFNYALSDADARRILDGLPPT